jgi:hypothetical protein
MAQCWEGVLIEILGVLEHDRYLEQRPDHSYAFVSRLLRDWWDRRFGHTYTRVSQR